MLSPLREKDEEDEEEEHHVNREDFQTQTQDVEEEETDEDTTLCFDRMEDVESSSSSSPLRSAKRARCDLVSSTFTAAPPPPTAIPAIVVLPSAAVAAAAVARRVPQPKAKPTLRRSNSVLGDNSSSSLGLHQPNFGSSPRAAPPQPPAGRPFLTRSSSCTLFSSSSSSSLASSQCSSPYGGMMINSSCRRSFDFANAADDDFVLRGSPPRLAPSEESSAYLDHSPLARAASASAAAAASAASADAAGLMPMLVNSTSRAEYYDEEEEREAAAAAQDEHHYVSLSALKLSSPARQHAKEWQTPTRDQIFHGQCANIDCTKMILRCQATTDVVVFDLDNTLLSIHTRSKFEGTGKDLAERIRPMFYVVIPALLARGICVGIATFSDQERLVEDMLREAFPGSVRLESNCFVRGNRRRTTNSKSGGGDDDSANHIDDDQGKRVHIQCILNRAGKRGLAPNRVLFVDDDRKNVQLAKQDGYRTVLFEDLCETVFFQRCLDVLRD